MWYWLKWGLSIVLVSFFFICIAANIQIFLMQIRRKSPDERAPSFILIAGGIAGAVGLFICPYQPAHYIFWLPVAVDIATVPAIALIYKIYKKINGTACK